VQDFEALASQLLAHAETLVPEWLNYGKRRGHEWVCGDVQGNPGESFSVNLQTGKWADFASPDVKGGDLISLYAAINNLTQIEAAKKLSNGEGPFHGKKNAMREHAPVESELRVLHRPPQTKFEAGMFKHPRHGTPLNFWVYRDAQGPLFVVARYEPEGSRKQIMPWIWDSTRWIAQGPPKPRPLYGLDRLAELSAPVLLVEGEKTADAAQRFWPGRPCVTWCGGVGQVGVADFEPLARREVTLWPDNDGPGIKAMKQIAGVLAGMDARVKIIDPSGFPEKWDLADAEAEGRGAADLAGYAKAHTKDWESSGVEKKPKEPPPASLFGLWRDLGLLTKSNGVPYSNQANAELAVAAKVRDRKLDVYFDEFSLRMMNGKEPWTDKDTSLLTSEIQTVLQISEMRAGTVHEGVAAYAYRNGRNPVRAWLEGLTWDETERLKDFIPKAAGAKRNIYSEAVGRCFIVAMVARVLRPGCKADCMPIFEGEQGINKTKMLQALGGEYFAEVHESMMSKDFCLAISGKMLCEISELNSLRRSDVERVKGMLSTPVDRFRPPYGRISQDYPRSCVFAGTTNTDDWNSDVTGARRFWPVRCGKINLTWLKENREQLFAEAVARFLAGEKWWDVPAMEAKIEQEARYEVDEWETMTQTYLATVDTTTIHHVMISILGLKAQDLSPHNQHRMSKILRRQGFKNTVRRVGAKLERRWLRVGVSEEE
jgi:putative DNA primase/helicase